MPAKTSTVAGFLAALPDERRPEVERLRAVIRRHLPDGYEEVISQKMLVYQVPFERYSDTYNGHPLWYVALSSEKSYLSLHLMPVYGSPALAAQLAEGFRSEGKKLDMGKACVRFKKADDVALDAIGNVVAAIPMDRWIETAQRARQRPRRGKVDNGSRAR